jgi:hypothetical protein
MQRGSKGIGDGGPTRIADLRASLRTAHERAPAYSKPPKPPKPRKQKPMRDSEEERALKAEKVAMAQHTTSLLNGGKNAGKNYKRPGELAERRGGAGGFVLQLILVLGVAGGVAYALDPTIVPVEWTDKAQDFISQYIKI